MASFKDSFYRGLSGKIGPIITYVRNGTQVVRAKSVPRDPKTPKQMAHRMKFTLINKGLPPLNTSIKLGHRGDTNAYRTLVGKAYHEAIIGEYPNFSLDYSKIKIAEGDLQLPAEIDFEYDVNTSTALFSWNTQIIKSKEMAVKAKDNDQVNIVLFNEKFMVADHLSGVAKRSAGTVSISVNSNWELDDTYFWVYMSSYDLQMNSDSLSVG